MSDAVISSRGRITVLSCGLGELPPGGEAILREADTVFGSRRLLELDPVQDPVQDAGRHRVVAAQARADAEAALALACEGQRVAILASGDALFHGLGGTLARLLEAIPAGEAPEIRSIPGVTAFQSLFHRLHLPWDTARVFSAHHEAAPLREILSTPLAVVYAGSACTAPQLAARLLTVQPEAAERAAVLADSLGLPTERLVRGTLADIAREYASPTAMLLLLPNRAVPPVLPLGLPVDAFEREAGLITPPDVRAILLSRLRLPAWGHLWDIGAGSGSIGLEAAALRPSLCVTAVERSPARADMIRRNAERLGLANHRTLAGAFPNVADLNTAAPCRIVLGGGGADLVPMLEAALHHLVPGGLLLVPALMLETRHRLYDWRPDLRTDLRSIDIAEEAPIAGSYHHLEPCRSIHLYTFTKPEGHA